MSARDFFKTCVGLGVAFCIGTFISHVVFYGFYSTIFWR